MEVFQPGAPRQAELGEVSIRTSPGSPYGALYAQIRPVTNIPYSPIRPLGKAYRVWPREAPIAAPVKLSFPFPEGAAAPERVHMYRKSGSDWSCETTTRDAGRLSINTRRFGTFMAMEDDQPPLLNELRPAEGFQTSSLRPTIQATIADPGSGIASYEVSANNRWLLTAYDPELNRVQWEADHDLSPGDWAITFRITDRAGNVTTATRRLRVAAVTEPTAK